MTTAPFIIERILNAPQLKIWNAITDADEMRKWYFDLKEFKAEKDFGFEFTGQGTDGQVFIHKCVVLDAEMPKLLRHSWTYEGLTGYSEVCFELYDEEGNTRVKLTHTGLETFIQNGASFQPENFAAGWTTIIGDHLKKYVEGV